LFIWAAYRGFSKGFLIQAAGFAALILGIWGAIKFSGVTTAFLMDKTNMEGEYLPLVSFAITFIAIVVLVHILSRLIEKLVQAVALGFVNRLVGAIFNLTKYALIISGVLVILNTINSKQPFLPQEDVDKSIMYGPLSAFAPTIFPYLNFETAENLMEKSQFNDLEI
jgi:membrane protein required for colicin V production